MQCAIACDLIVEAPGNRNFRIRIKLLVDVTLRTDLADMLDIARAWSEREAVQHMKWAHLRGYAAGVVHLSRIQ